MPRPNERTKKFISDYREDTLKWIASRRFGSTITQLYEDLNDAWGGFRQAERSRWSGPRRVRYLFHTRHRLRRLLTKMVHEGVINKTKRSQDIGDLFSMAHVTKRDLARVQQQNDRLDDVIQRRYARAEVINADVND